MPSSASPLRSTTAWPGRGLPSPFLARARRGWRFVVCSTALWSAGDGAAVHGNPDGLTVVKGDASAVADGAKLTIQVGQHAVLDWSSFNIAAGEATIFQQPGRDALVLNRIHDQNPSQIWGSLTANGTVVLANGRGFYFGPDSKIAVGGSFVATTATLPPDFGAGGLWSFTGLPPAASILNYGQIETPDGGSVFLIAERIENHGTLQASGGGGVWLEAGREVLVSERPDGRGLSAKVTLPTGSVDNFGRVTANAGTIALHAKVVNQGGVLEANTVRERNGRIELLAEDVVLGATGVATAEASGVSRIAADSAFANSGAQEITVQATHDLTLSRGTAWDLSAATAASEDGIARQLTLRAGHNILFEENARVFDANAWSIRLEAGYDLARAAVVADAGSILLNGGTGKSLNGALETARGNIEAVAGRDVLVGTGYVRTTAGGAIQLATLSGDIDAGKKNDTYEFLASGYRISLAGAGGIATLAGGDVVVDAGRDLIANPTTPANQPPGGLGALGAEPGDVNLSAGRLVTGNFFVRNGQGTVRAGVTVEDGQVREVLNPGASVGSVTRPVSLSLVDGGWSVWAAKDITLSEIRNPNGTFNRNRQAVPVGAYVGNLDANGGVVAAPERSAFLFDYAKDASASLWAGHGITLLGANLPRVTGQNTGMRAVYPPRLSLEAGAGGIEVQNSLVLFPSTEGALSVRTHDGGDLVGRQLQSVLTGITMSDSGLPDYNTFFEGHARTPLHLDDVRRVEVDVSGGIANFSLTVPLAARIVVGEDAYNFGFRGQNTRVGAETEISVGGDLRYRGNLTETAFRSDLPLLFFDPVYAANLPLALRVRYDTLSGKLTFAGQMTQNELEYLQHPQVLVFDPVSGQPVLDPITGLQVTAPLEISAEARAAFQQLYVESQTASLGDQGLSLAGPGRFSVRADNADLGISGGITVRHPNAALLALSPRGAELDVRVTGDLAMTATRIANESYLGGITLEAGGRIDVGGQASVFDNAGQAKGIFTTSGGSIQVEAQGDVNVNGSRIAVYNGGDLRVRSVEGDVNAGSGGAGYVTVSALEPDPVTGEMRTLFGVIPGSGLLATTLPGSHAVLGNIEVEAAQGSILSSLGGVIQLAFNDQPANDSFIRLQAGKNIDAGGSGIIGSNVRLDAGGEISGVVIGSRKVDIDSRSSVNVTAFSSGGVSINAAGSVSGTVVGGGNVAVSGDSISAALVSQSVSTSGDTSSAAVGVPTSTAPRADSNVTEDAASATTRKSASELEDEDEKKRRLAAAPKVTRTVGRVTVILPTPAKN